MPYRLNLNEVKVVKRFQYSHSPVAQSLGLCLLQEYECGITLTLMNRVKAPQDKHHYNVHIIILVSDIHIGHLSPNPLERVNLQVCLCLIFVLNGGFPLDGQTISQPLIGTYGSHSELEVVIVNFTKTLGTQKLCEQQWEHIGKASEAFKTSMETPL